MRSKLRRFEVLLPTRFNDGRDVLDAWIAEALDEVIGRFGSVSFQRDAVEGYWHHGGVQYRD